MEPFRIGASLQHAQECWAGQCDVIVDEIDGAHHRKIMDADERFHHAMVLDYSSTSQTKKVRLWNMSLILTVFFSQD